MQNEELKNIEQRIASEAFNLQADIDLLWNVASRIKTKQLEMDNMYKEYKTRLEQKEKELNEREMKILQQELGQQSPVKLNISQPTGYIAVPTNPIPSQPVHTSTSTSQGSPSRQEIKIKEINEQSPRTGATIVVKPLTVSTSNPSAESSPRKVQFSEETVQTPSPVNSTPTTPQKPPSSPSSVPMIPSRLERSQSEHERTLSEKEPETRIRSYSFQDTTNTTPVSSTSLSQSTSSVEAINKENQTNSSEKPLERYSMFIPFDNPKKKGPPRLSSGSPASKSFVADRIAAFGSPPKVPVTHSSSSPTFTSPSKARPRSTIIGKIDFASFEAEQHQQQEYSSSPRKTVTSK